MCTCCPSSTRPANGPYGPLALVCFGHCTRRPGRSGLAHVSICPRVFVRPGPHSWQTGQRSLVFNCLCLRQMNYLLHFMLQWSSWDKTDATVTLLWRREWGGGGVGGAVPAAGLVPFLCFDTIILNLLRRRIYQKILVLLHR